MCYAHLADVAAPRHKLWATEKARLGKAALHLEDSILFVTYKDSHTQ